MLKNMWRAVLVVGACLATGAAEARQLTAGAPTFFPSTSTCNSR
jgi:hypothetical protein